MPLPTVFSRDFGSLSDGRNTRLYSLSNRAGSVAEISDYGARVVSVSVPDRHGVIGDVVLGCASASAYEASHDYLGALIGRYANRIANASFALEGTSYQLARNFAGRHCLHGGSASFDVALWTLDELAVVRGVPTVSLSLVSPDGAGGFPGSVTVRATYTFDDANRLGLALRTTTDKTTVINLTSHAYFDLSSGASPDAGAHELQIHASRFLPTDGDLIPTGELRAVAGTAFDFRQPTRIDAHVVEPDPQLMQARGFDHTWVLDGDGIDLRHCARLFDPHSGRTLDVYATAPGLQFYSGNFLDGTTLDKRGRPLTFRRGICLEPQNFPDAPNQPSFPSPVLQPGATHETSMLFQFRAVSSSWT